MAHFWKCLVGAVPFFALSALAFGQVQVSGPVGHALPVMPAVPVAPAASAAPSEPAGLPASLKSDDLSAREVVKMHDADPVGGKPGRNRIVVGTRELGGKVQTPAISWIDGRAETSSLVTLPLAESLSSRILESVDALPPVDGSR